MATWFREVDLLTSIYSLPHEPCSSAQDSAYCLQLCCLVQDFAQTSGDQTYRKVADIICNVRNSGTNPEPNVSYDVHWLGEYGCAWIIYPGLATLPSSIELVCLDCWEFGLNGNSSTCKREFTSRPHDNFGHRAIQVGKIHSSRLSVLFTKFNDFLNKAKQKAGNQRSAVNSQGHQKTPAFIFAVLRDSLSSEQNSAIGVDREQEHYPRGAFTDVGLHTGGFLSMPFLSMHACRNYD